MSIQDKRHDDTQLEEALAPIVNRLIDKNYEESQEKIASQIAPLIGGAIREQIKSQKDDVVDALYPVIGNMISRYVTKTLEDMLNKINTQIQNGLSFSAFKRKIVAKMKGISETELLLNENASANIRALLLIHKETGIVLAHSENPNSPVSEPEMLASMMTAIRSFVNDWVSQNSEHHELGEIEYGGNKIIIEASGYSYLAVIVEGSTYKATYDKIRTTLEQIVLHHGESIRTFTGDSGKFENLEIYREISRLLQEDAKETEEKKIHPLMFLIPLVLFSFGTYSYYQNYELGIVQKQLMQTLYKTPQLTSYRLSVDFKEGVVTLSGEVPFTYHKQLATKSVSRIEGIKSIINNIVVIESFKDPMQTSANIAYLLKGLNTSNAINLKYTYDFTILTLEGSVWDSQHLKEVQTLFESMKEIHKIRYKIIIVPPELKSSIYFKKNSTTLTNEAQTTLIKNIAVLKKLDKNTSITLSAYSDLIGSTKRNARLSKKRLSRVLEFLQNRGALQQEFILKSYDAAPKDVNINLEPQKARKIIITYTQKGE